MARKPLVIPFLFVDALSVMLGVINVSSMDWEMMSALSSSLQAAFPYVAKD